MRACVCVCMCVFNTMCVLERAIDQPTPTERCCVVYDFSRESRCILSFPGVSGRDMRSAPPQRIGAAFMPGQSERGLSLAQE